MLETLIMATTTALAAFDPPVDSAGALAARITGPARIEATATPFVYEVGVSNAAGAPVKLAVRLAGIDGWRFEPESRDLTVPANGSATASFVARVPAGIHNAHYPVHAFITAASIPVLHPVLVVETAVPDPPRATPAIPWTPVAAPADGELALWRLPVRRVVVRAFGEPARTLPPNWSGTDGATRAQAGFTGGADRGGWREAITAHPPWSPKPGTILVEYPVRLPAGKVRLAFANAIRDHAAAAAEPPSDGVTFRIRVAPLDSPDGTEGEAVFDRHTASKKWLAGTADLSRFAGQAVRIQLESHPGPKNDTTCDMAYWAEPVLVAGIPASAARTAPKAGPARILGTIVDGPTKWTARATPGARGLLDAKVEFRSGDRKLSFKGFRVRVLGDALDDPRSPSVLREVVDESPPGGIRLRHRFECWAGSFEVVGELAASGPALRASFHLENAPPPSPWTVVRLDEVAAGPWSAAVRRVYAGPGNVIEKPGAFDLGFDGHRNSTSFVGFDFVGGISVVQGVDAVPDALRVDPGSRRASLSSPGNQVVSFIPCRTVWAGARAWHDSNGLAAAGGVARLAGRFVFDIWGGKYADGAEALKRAFAHGLTDSVVIWHVWQGHGYDYRLPDIWPPRGEYGTLAGFAALAQACRDRGVLFAPHDNYIDFYPDSGGFSYDKIAFDAGGAPVKAWLNSWHANAQSYRSRPDAVREPLERNVRLIRKGIAPDAYFIDVWSSIGPYDCWTRDGRFIDRSFTRTVWGEAFAWIRNELGGNAPQISESGHDSLIGWLDGAQANHLRVGPPLPGDMSWCTWNIPCADAERVPWFDAAHHDRFVLHGAGYPGRYEAGLDPKAHGIYSDDYISTEVLCGRPAMVREAFSRDAVRVYWLTHDLARSLALGRMDRVEFAGGNLHRQTVFWEDGTVVRVNRGKTAWTVAGHDLPPFGFHARSRDGTVEMGVERRGGRVVEWARGPSGIHLDPRGGKATVAGVTATGACRVALIDGALTVTPLPGSGAFTVGLNWKALPWKLPLPASAEAVSEDGSVIRSAPVRITRGSVSLSCDPGVFRWRIR